MPKKKEEQWTLDRSLADSTSFDNFDFKQWVEYTTNLNSTEWFNSINILNEKLEKKRKIVYYKFRSSIKIINKIFEIQNKIFLQYGRVNQIANSPFFDNLIATAYMKSTLGIYASYDLTIKGLFGPARSLFRYVFEFLLIAKFCSITEDFDLFKKWEGGGKISIQKQIFNNIEKPKMEEMNNFWESLCRYTHATIYSMQPNFNIKGNEKDIQINLIFILLLLECNYHLLNVHYANSSRMYFTKYFKNDEVQKLRKEIRFILNHYKKRLTPSSKRLVMEYCANWKMKSYFKTRKVSVEEMVDYFNNKN